MAVLGGLIVAAGCESPKGHQATGGDQVKGEPGPRATSAEAREGPVVPMGKATASEFISHAVSYAQRNLDVASPQLSFVLLGCIDMDGRLDPLSSSCPGSMVATFEEEPRGSFVAFIVVGKAGMVGSKASRTEAISLAPARCAVERSFELANGANLRWSPSRDIFFGYGPTVSGAAWFLKSEGTVLFSLSDADCTMAPPVPSRGGRAVDGGRDPRN